LDQPQAAKDRELDLVLVREKVDPSACRIIDHGKFKFEQSKKKWDFGYRECDRLGGVDQYSASKEAAALAISSWRESFCGKDGHQTEHLEIATDRTGNVIGGGDWSEDRIIPDPIRALTAVEQFPSAIHKPLALGSIYSNH